MAYKDLVNRFSVTPPGRWVARTLASRIDPFLYRLSGGRFTSVGPPSIPQLVLTTKGRRSGKARAVQLGFVEDTGGYLVVASNFGQPNHPAWSYNLIADPKATVQLDTRRLDVIAEQLSEEEKTRVWPKLEAAIPQFGVYVKRTARDIKVFRLRPAGRGGRTG